MRLVKTYQHSRLLVWVLLLMYIIPSCREEVTEVDPIDEDLVFRKNSEIGQAIRGISLLDGSSDNILDNSNHHKVVLPVSITFRGESLVITNETQIADLTEAFIQNPYQGLPKITSFPIQLITSDYLNITVDDEVALRNLSQTSRSLPDEDIECLDFRYPVKVATYDELNQLADVVTIRGDEQLYHLIHNEKDNDLLSLQYPVVMTRSDQGEEVIANNEEFTALLATDSESCDENDLIFEEQDNPPLLQTLSLFLTDAPFPYDLIAEVNVHILRIEVKTGAANDTVPFITIMDDEQTFNMLSLTNGTTADLGQIELPVGSYEFFRMFVDDGNVVMNDGEVFELKVPSGSQSGIKIQPNENIEIIEGENPEFLLDFDVSKSLVVRGNPDSPNGITGFNFKPVIRAINLANTGSLSGEVTAFSSGEVLANAHISLLAADTVYTTSVSNELGEYKIIGLAEGSYDILVELDNYLPYEQSGISITANQETIHDIQLQEE